MMLLAWEVNTYSTYDFIAEYNNLLYFYLSSSSFLVFTRQLTKPSFVLCLVWDGLLADCPHGIGTGGGAGCVSSQGK